MPTYMRLAAGIAIVTVLGVGALVYLGPGPNIGPPGATASPSPAPSPTPAATPAPTLPPIDTADWTTFASTRYGFTIKHPTDWTEKVSDHDWTFETDIESWTSTATESFVNPAPGAVTGVRASGWSVRVTPGTTAASWLQAFCDGTNTTPCAGFQDVLADVETGDGHPGLLTQFGEDTMAAFVDGETVYVVAIWRTETHPSVQPYGGARRLIEAYISTLLLPAESPLGSPGPS